MRIRDGRRMAPGVARGFLHQPSLHQEPCAQPVCSRTFSGSRGHASSTSRFAKDAWLSTSRPVFGSAAVVDAAAAFAARTTTEAGHGDTWTSEA